MKLKGGSRAARWKQPWLEDPSPTELESEMVDLTQAHEAAADSEDATDSDEHSQTALFQFLKTTMCDAQLKCALTVGAALFEIMELHECRAQEWQYRDGTFFFNDACGAESKEAQFTVHLGHIASPDHYVLLVPCSIENPPIIPDLKARDPA